MVTNHAKGMYKMMEKFNLDPIKPKKKGNGLLTPMNNFRKTNKDSIDRTKEPAYRVAKYTNTIRNKRMELRNDGNKTA